MTNSNFKDVVGFDVFVHF